MAVALGLAALVGTAQAQIKFDEGGGSMATSGGTIDSTTFTLVSGGSDTTQWIPVGSIRFAHPSFAGLPLWKAVFNSSSIASGDTIALVVQYSVDKTVIMSKASVDLIASASAPIPFVVLTADTNANAPALGFPWVRMIFTESDVTRTAPYVSCSLKYVYITEP